MSDAPPPGVIQNLTSLAEPLIKGAAIIAVFGYMALRAHFNRLGVPAPSVFDLQRYLTETYLFVASTTPHVVFAGALLAGLAFLARASAGARWAQVTGRVSPHVEWLLPALLTVSYVLLLRRMDWTQDVAVGELTRDRLTVLPEDDLLIWLVFVCAGAAFILISHGEWTSRVWRVAALTMLWVLALHIPLIYGQSMRPAMYPTVSLFQGKNEPPLCGLLVLESAAHYEIWRAEPHPGPSGTTVSYGVFTRIPQKEVSIARLGPLRNVLLEAENAVANPADPQPSCF